MSRFILPQPSTGQFDPLGNRIRRPMNAFMIFANQHRTDMTARMPGLNNTEISVKLGEIWSSMTEDEKEIYFRKSKQEELDHYHRYPDYIYNPKTSKTLRDLRQQDEMRRRYISADDDVTDQDYYEHYLGDRVSSVEYAKPKLKRKNLLQPAPSVFQIPRPSRLKQDRPQPDQEQYHDTDHQERQPYMYPYSSGQPTFSSRFIQSVYRQSPRHRYNQKPSDRELLAMYSQPVRFPYTVPSRERTEYHLRKLDGYSRARDNYHEAAASYMNEGNNLDVDAEDTLLDEECQRAVQSITSEMDDDTESSNDSVRDEETNYVMIPCDVNIARMLGWPVHMLQRVSQSMLERIQQESVRSLELQHASGISRHPNQPSPDSPSKPSSTSHTSEGSTALHDLSGIHQSNIKGTNDETADFDMHEVKRRCLIDLSARSKDATATKIDLPDDKSASVPRNSQLNNGDGFKTEPKLDILSENYTNADKRNEQEATESKDRAKIEGDQTKYKMDKERKLDVFPPQQSSQAEDDVKVSCPMDTEFKVFPSSESEDELEAIDTSSMSASFGHLDSELIAAYHLSNSQGSDKIDSFVQ